MSMPAYVGINFVDTLHNDIYPAIDPTKSDLSQPSKVVLVTGAGRGIGRSIAIEYAKAQVAHLILCARTATQLDSVEKDIKAVNQNVKVTKLSLDVTDESQVVAAANKIKQDIGRLDILINNAGTGEPWVPITESNADEWWWSWTVPIKGAYLMLRSFLPLLVETAEKEKTTADVINVSSVGAHVVFPGASAYQTAKMALLRLGEFVTKEYGAKGVNCVGIHPGGVLTELSKDNPYVQNMLGDAPELCGGFAVWFTKGQRTWLAGRYASVQWDVDELEAKKDEIVAGDKLKLRMVV